jgi:hypothetical protein
MCVSYVELSKIYNLKRKAFDILLINLDFVFKGKVTLLVYFIEMLIGLGSNLFVCVELV